MEAAVKGNYPQNSHTLLNLSTAFYFRSFSNTQITFNVFHLFIDPDEQQADNLTKVAAIDINNLLTKTSDISKGILYNIQQILLKEWGPDSLGVLPEDTMQELLTGVIQSFSFLSVIPIFSHVGSYLSYYLVHCKAISLLLFSGFEFTGTGHSFRRKSSPIEA